MGWNDLSPKEQADWKKKNYDMGINVSQGTIDDMTSRKTPEGNFEYFKKNKPNAEQREGLNRFYGTERVNSALDGGGAKPKKSSGFPTNTGTTGLNIIGPSTIGPGPTPKPIPGPTPKDKNPNIPGPGNPQMPSDFNNMAPKKKGGGEKEDNDWDEKIPGALGGAAIGSFLGPLGMAAGGYIGGGGKMPHITMPRVTPTEKGALIGGALGGVPGAVAGAAIGRYGAGIRAVGHELGEAAGSAARGAGRVVHAGEDAVESAAHGIGAAGSAIAHAASSGAHTVGHELGEVGHAIGNGVHSVISGIGGALGGLFGGMAGGTTTIARRTEPTAQPSVSNPVPTGHPVSSQFTRPMSGIPKGSLPVPDMPWLPGSPNAPKTGDSQHQNRTSFHTS